MPSGLLTDRDVFLNLTMYACSPNLITFLAESLEGELLPCVKKIWLPALLYLCQSEAESGAHVAVSANQRPSLARVWLLVGPVQLRWALSLLILYGVCLSVCSDHTPARELNK